MFSCEDIEEDNAPPSVALTFPQNGSIVYEIANITCISTDNKAVAKVELWVNGVSTGVTDETEPYSFSWNTTLINNGDYSITVRSYDTSDNITDSAPIVLSVDNTISIPMVSNVTSVSYSLTEMEVEWTPSSDGDFKDYKIWYSETQNGNRSIIQTFTDISVISHSIQEFDPTHENWFWVQVTDTLGYSSIGTGMTNEIDSHPTKSTIYDVLYLDNKFTVSWSKNKDADFQSYTLHESFSEDMSGATLINETNLVTDTTYIVTGVSVGETRYYQIVTNDVFGLETESDVEIAGSSYPLPTEFPLFENAGLVYERRDYSSVANYNNDIPDTVYNDTLFILTDIDEDGYFGYSWDLSSYYNLVNNFDNKFINYGRRYLDDDEVYIYTTPYLWVSYDEFYDTTEYALNYGSFPASRTETVEFSLGKLYNTYKHLNLRTDYYYYHYTTIEGFLKWELFDDYYSFYQRVIFIEKLNNAELQNALNIARGKRDRKPYNSLNNFINDNPFSNPMFDLSH